MLGWQVPTAVIQGKRDFSLVSGSYIQLEFSLVSIYIFSWILGGPKTAYTDLAIFRTIGPSNPIFLKMKFIGIFLKFWEFFFYEMGCVC